MVQCNQLWNPGVLNSFAQSSGINVGVERSKGNGSSGADTTGGCDIGTPETIPRKSSRSGVRASPSDAPVEGVEPATDADADADVRKESMTDAVGATAPETIMPETLGMGDADDDPEAAAVWVCGVTHLPADWRNVSQIGDFRLSGGDGPLLAVASGESGGREGSVALKALSLASHESASVAFSAQVQLWCRNAPMKLGKTHVNAGQGGEECLARTLWRIQSSAPECTMVALQR